MFLLEIRIVRGIFYIWSSMGKDADFFILDFFSLVVLKIKFFSN